MAHRFSVFADRDSARELNDAINLNEADRLWCKETGGKIIYAVDNDIIKLYADTAGKALGQHGESGYTRIFSGDKETHIIGIGRILSHFIFFGRERSDSDRAPLFLIPPLDAEFATIFSGVFRKSGEEHQSAHASALRFEGLVQDSEKSDAEVASALIANADDVLKLLIGGETLQTELFRLCELVNEGRVTSLNEVNAVEMDISVEFTENVNRQLSLKELIWHNALSEAWCNGLAKASDKEKKKAKLRVDADAMARLQILNMRLESANIRLIMITGSPRLLNVAKKMIGRKPNLSFADSWLRHPRGFLGEPDIFRGNPELEAAVDTNRLPEMLDAFLAENDRNTIQQVAPREMAGSLYLEEMKKFQSYWDELSARLCLAHSDIISSSNINNETVTELVAKIRRADSTIKQFLSDAWHSAFLAAMQTGFIFSWSLRRDVRRNVPQLVFESFHDASNFVGDLLTQMRHAPGTAIENFPARIETVKRDGSRGYTTYLVFGELFAAHDLWQVTMSLADSALRRVFPDTSLALCSIQNDSERLITGREAYYLKAVSGRHLATSVADLGLAHTSILLAQSMLELEREIRGKDLLKGDCRFRYERCSINVAAAMFEKFLSSPGLGSDGMSAREMHNELEEIIECVANDLAEVTSWGGRYLSSRIYTSIFIVEIVLMAKPGDRFPARLLTKLEEFRELFVVESIGQPTKLSKVVFSVADCWGEPDSEHLKIKKAKAQADIELAKKFLTHGECMPYEAARYQYFGEFIALIGVDAEA